MRRGKPLLLAAGAGLAGAALAAMLLLARPAAPVGGEPLSAALASLRAPQYDPRFGLEYWTGQLVDGGREWRPALDFCRDRSPERFPNCRTIGLLDTVGRIPGFPGVELARGPEGAP